jgi:hypothetical protein
MATPPPRRWRLTTLDRDVAGGPYARVQLCLADIQSGDPLDEPVQFLHLIHTATSSPDGGCSQEPMGRWRR